MSALERARELAGASRGCNQDPQAVLDAIAAIYFVSVDQLVGPRRTEWLTLPRQIAMVMLREHCGMSYPDIGRRLDRDHTTIIHGVNKIRGRRMKDPEFAELLDAIRAAIEEVDS